MSIKGNLETVYLPTILQMLSSEDKTGILRLQKEDNEVHIYIQNGFIVYATESGKKIRLGDMLKQNGILSSKQIQECLKESIESKKALGKVVLEKGYVTRNELNALIMKQAENTLYNVFLWETGEFEYTDTPLNLKRIVVHKIDIMTLLLEATRRIDEISVLKKQIPHEDMILKISGNVRGGKEIKLNPAEWRMLSMLDGTSNVRKILDKSGLDDFNGYKILNSLISSGKVEVCEPKPLPNPAGDALAQFKGMDAKTFRMGLDDLGLKRSSLLRIALTRIFRDAEDESALLSAVGEEAAKLCNAVDKRTLFDIKGKNQVPFLKDILHLLCEAVGENPGAS